MTIERFLEVLDLIQSVETRLKIQTTLDGISSNLSTLVNSPGQPAQQTALATNLSKLAESVSQLTRELSPADRETIVELGGGNFFDAELATGVSDSVAKNAMTPSVARDFVLNLVNRRSSFLDNVNQAAVSLRELNVKASRLQPGAADASFLIPRELFKNELDSFAKELRFISKLFADYSEALTGHRESVQLETLSSSVPTIVLLAAVPLLSQLGDVVNKFLEAWKKIEEIRELRARIAAVGVKRTAYNDFTDEINATVDRVIDEVVQDAISHYKGEEARKNELMTALRQDTRKLFGQIERGLQIQFRTGPEDGEPVDLREDLRKLSQLGKELEFPPPSTEPLLLEAGEVIGEDADDAHAKKPKLAAEAAAPKGRRFRSE